MRICLGNSRMISGGLGTTPIASLRRDSRGAKDRTVLQAARTAGRVLLTLDKGIASLLQHPVHEHAGVVLFGPDTAGRQIGRASWRERGQTAAGKGLAKYVDLWLRCAHGSSLH